MAIGRQALTAQDGGSLNTAVGYQAGDSVTDGDNNTLIGGGAGGAITSGTNNIAIGQASGSVLATGSNNVYIGRDSDASSTGVNNEIVIGEGTAGNGSNTVTLGNGSVSGLHCQVSSISALSDKRDKTNIEHSGYGLNIIENLKPVTFEWDQRDGKRKGLKDVGFIAQDLQSVDDEYIRLVNSNDPEKLQATYGRLIPIMAKAIQELSAEVKQLKEKLNG